MITVSINQLPVIIKQISTTFWTTLQCTTEAQCYRRIRNMGSFWENVLNPNEIIVKPGKRSKFKI